MHLYFIYKFCITEDMLKFYTKLFVLLLVHKISYTVYKLVAVLQVTDTNLWHFLSCPSNQMHVLERDSWAVHVAICLRLFFVRSFNIIPTSFLQNKYKAIVKLHWSAKKENFFLLLLLCLIVTDLMLLN